ncbi:hypothetical protein WPG_1144 [Winogradskyella sp. PG-2]|nr:hypothetical protein WPG_1144 [Winogradskyella sp. PG-2]
MENKTSKYFKYAIGEIILVVIGILIALQINNWNQERINQQKAIVYLNSLIEDIESDVINYNGNITNYQTSLNNNKRLLINDDYKLLEGDSIIKLVSGYYEVDRTSSQTYEKIKNAGLAESLGSEEVNKVINDYYNAQKSYYQTMLRWDKDFSDKDVNFWTYNTNYESSSIRNYNTNALPFLNSAAKRKEDLINLIESTQGRNHLRNAIIRKEHTLYRANEFVVTAENLINLITKELNSK